MGLHTLLLCATLFHMMINIATKLFKNTRNAKHPIEHKSKFPYS